MLRRLSLRARLLLGVVLLSAVALTAADVATYTSLRSFLLSRVDAGLEASHGQVEPLVLGGANQPNGQPNGPPNGSGPPAQGIDWYQVRTVSGQVLKSGFLIGSGSPPKLPAQISIPSTPTSNSHGERVTYFTVPSTDGSTSYRVRASVEPQYPDRVLIVAATLGDVYGTLHRLLRIELLVTGIALAAIAGIGLWVVRLGLRPLEDIEATASTIAGGDLSHRVERADTTTEVGRLGASLNAMLGQIEAAFKAREESEDRLRRSEGRLRRFVADASHELRTPLSAIRAYAELFARGAADRPQDLARSMSGITRESERMSVLVEDLLLLARLDEGRPLERQQVDLADVAAEAVDAAHAVDHEREIELVSDPAIVLGDRDRLRQLIDNLLVNARSHTPPGTRVGVCVHQFDGQAELRVSDSGPGFSEEEASHVFERFYRIDSSRTRASGGVGLGLSIVAAIAKAHDGSAHASPTPGGGATLVVRMPLAASVDEPGAIEPASAPAAGSDSQH